jgi:hypothetical protein
MRALFVCYNEKENFYAGGKVLKKEKDEKYQVLNGRRSPLHCLFLQYYV